jgi:putative membrane protein
MTLGPVRIFFLTLGALAVSAVRPYDYLTWFLEVVPVLVGLPLLAWTRRAFPLTPMVYQWLFLHALVLMLGGHYTYARVPLGEWAREWLHLSRNHYDRVGHFFQGFVPALLTRELLLRRSPLRPGKWLFLLSTCVPMAFSSLYEMFEWQTAKLGGSKADDFLGTQGDPWDTQEDMFMAMVGALCANLFLSRAHTRQVESMGPAQP